MLLGWFHDSNTEAAAGSLGSACSRPVASASRLTFLALSLLNYKVRALTRSPFQLYNAMGMCHNRSCALISFFLLTFKYDTCIQFIKELMLLHLPSLLYFKFRL